MPDKDEEFKPLVITDDGLTGTRTPLPFDIPKIDIVEVGWLVELSGPQWWAGDSWTPDADKAIRFARRADAEKMISVMRLNKKIFASAVATEHEWS